MRLGIELLALADMYIPPGSHFELRVTVNGTPVEETAGRDEFRSDALVRTGNRIAATGRINIWDERVSPPFTLRVRPAFAVPVSIRPGDGLGFRLSTSLPLDHGTLQASLAARIVSNASPPGYILLSDPGIALDWQTRGRFQAELGKWPTCARKGGESR